VTVSRSVVPGDWYGVLGDEVVVLLPPEAKARVAPIWERVDERASFDEVLDAVISGGLRDLPAFVLVSLVGEWGGEPGADVKVVIRGAGDAELTTTGGPVTVSGAADTTWVEQNLAGVSGLRIRVGAQAAGDGTPYAVGNGLVRVSAVEQAVIAPDAVEEEPAVPEPEPIPVEAEPAPPPAPPATPPVARLVFSSGEVVDVDGSVVVGRAPDPRRRGLDDEARLVTVPSPHQEISSTHLEIRPGTGPDHGMAVVTDLGSTNGTVVVQPGLPAEDLRPGIGVQLLPGAIVDLGEGVTIQVTNP
jgi:hypothetical protein